MSDEREEPTRRALVMALMSSGLLPACEVVDVERTLRGLDGAGLATLTSNEDFYVYQHGPQPDLVGGSLRILDRGVEVAVLSFDELEELPVQTFEHTLQCIGSPTHRPQIGNAIWGGMPLVDVLARVGFSVAPEHVDLRLVGFDNYYTSVPAQTLGEGPVWLVWQMNGEPLPFDHGAPARLIVPGRYGVKNLKWVREIEFLDHAHVDYWDQFGWNHDAEIRAAGFIILPGYGDEVETPTRVFGIAFAGLDPISEVELTDDGGLTWMPCTLDYQPGGHVWTLWSVLWSPERSGVIQIQVRVRTEGGQESVLTPGGSDPLGGFDGGTITPVLVT